MNSNVQQTGSPPCKADEMNYPIMVPDDRLGFWAQCYNYNLGEKIGEGSFGKVFKATHTKTNMLVAFKFIFKFGELKQLQQEVEIQHKLHHPNIVKMLESFENENGIALVMEFVPRSLKQIIETEGILSEKRAQIIICHLVSALHYLHRNNILHRDLKPPNVLVDNNDVAKLCDFGLARFMLTGTQVLTQASLKGTPLYMAPEVISSPVIPPTYNHNADLWSLGCITYHLLCGKPPFDTNCLMHLVQMMKDHPISWPNTVSPICLNFLEQLLQKNPLRRLTWPGLLEHEFVKNRVFTVNQHHDVNDIVSPLNSLKIVEEEEDGSNSSSDHNVTSIDETTEEDLCSSQSSWCSETCQELDVSSNKTNSTCTNTNYDFISEEWIEFLQQTAAEALSGNFTSMKQKSFILVILSSIKNDTVSANILKYVVSLLALPFVSKIEQSEKNLICQIYIETEVISCLMQSFSNAFKLPTRKSVSPAPPTSSGIQELDRLESVFLLVEGLSLDRPIECIKQFIESVVSLKSVPLIQRCLLLSHGNVRLVSNTLAVLIITVIYMPSNIAFVQDIIVGNYIEGRIPNIELHKLLRHENPVIRERICILLLHIVRLDSESFTNFWHQTLTDDIEYLKRDKCRNVAQAAGCASTTLQKSSFYILEQEDEDSDLNLD